MPARTFVFVACSSLLSSLSITGIAQDNGVTQGVRYLAIGEREEARAKEIRLKWIDGERSRIRDERKEYDNELTELKKSLPDPIRARVVPPAVAKAQERERTAFNDWASSNDPDRTAAILKGGGLNALLRVLGPIAHYRQMRASANSEETRSLFPSLKPSEKITAADASHLRMAPATSAGSKNSSYLNQLPLELKGKWPPIVLQNWDSDRKSIEKLRDDYIGLIQSAEGDSTKYLNQAELLDNALELLQAKLLHKQRSTPDETSLSATKKTQRHRDMQEAIRYLETVRATAERLKNVPSDYKAHQFTAGTVEDFLEFCYLHGMIFQEARAVDQEYYLKMFRRMQDYARDVQYVEDWKSDLDQRIRELDRDDQRLVWRASEQ